MGGFQRSSEIFFDALRVKSPDALKGRAPLTAPPHPAIFFTMGMMPALSDAVALFLAYPLGAHPGRLVTEHGLEEAAWSCSSIARNGWSASRRRGCHSKRIKAVPEADIAANGKPARTRQCPIFCLTRPYYNARPAITLLAGLCMAAANGSDGTATSAGLSSSPRSIRLIWSRMLCRTSPEKGPRCR